MAIPTINSVTTKLSYHVSPPITTGSFTLVGLNLAEVTKVVIADAQQDPFYTYPWTNGGAGALTNDGKYDYLEVHGYPWSPVSKQPTFDADSTTAGPGDYVIITITTSPGTTTTSPTTQVSYV